MEMSIEIQKKWLLFEKSRICKDHSFINVKGINNSGSDV